jgi:hypothetical protein
MSSSSPLGSQSPWRPDYIRKLQAECTPNDLSLSDNRFVTVALDDRDQVATVLIRAGAGGAFLEIE